MSAKVNVPQMPLSRQVSGFVAHLRLNGMKLGPAETHSALKVLARGELLPLTRVRDTLKILLTGRKSEWERFDDLFEAYWLRQGRVRERISEQESRAAGSRSAARFWASRVGTDQAPEARSRDLDPPGATGVPDRRSTPTASRQHGLRRTDLRHLADPSAMALARQIAFRLARALRYRISRRYRQARAAQRLDLRRTIRRSLARGGDPLSLVHRARLDRPVRIVLMLDTSGSMKPYTPYLIQFVRGLVSGWPDTDAYVFNTRLARVTEVLREKDSILAMSRLALMAQGIGGGTRMSDCLATFNDHFARRSLNSRSVFIMLSDGYDTGEPGLFVEQLARLKRRVRKLVWLNPMLGWECYQPVTRSMRAALPYIDHFASAHSLNALAELEDQFARI